MALTTEVEKFLVEACATCEDTEQVRYMVDLLSDAFESLDATDVPDREEMVEYCQVHLGL